MPTQEQQQPKNGNGPSEEKALTVSYLIIRKSPIFLAVELVLIEAIFLLVLILLWLLAPGFLAQPVAGNPILLGVGTILLVSALGAKLVVVIVAVLKWVNEFYEVTPGEIVKRWGVLSNHREVFDIKDVKSISTNQDFFGKVLRYGTLRLFSPALNEPIVLENIPNPNRHQELIAELIPSIHPSRSTTFLRTSGTITS